MTFAINTDVSFECVILQHFTHIFFAAIDIVIGGPPSIHDEQGQYLLKMSKIIKQIQAGQADHRLFFLMENDIFGGNNDNRHDAVMAVDNQIGVCHTIWDAKYLSPCKRKRSYWLNVCILWVFAVSLVSTVANVLC
jgi:hypothetical protein